MNEAGEKPGRFDQELVEWLKISRPEVFWMRQKNWVLMVIRASERKRRPFLQTWILIPVLAGMAAVFFFFGFDSLCFQPAAPSQSYVEKIPPPEDWNFLEKLPLLENWENIRPMSQGRS
jgi:hypothetical protein